MKNNYLRITVALAFLFASCNKVKTIANIDIDVPYTQTIIGPDLGKNLSLPATGVALSLPPYKLATDMKSTLATYNITPANLMQLTLKSFSFKNLSAAANSFNFVDTVRIYLSTPGLPDKFVAYTYHVMSNTDSLALTCANDDLKQYLLQDSVTLTLQGHFTKVPPANVPLKLNMNFNVLANPLN